MTSYGGKSETKAETKMKKWLQTLSANLDTTTGFGDGKGNMLLNTNCVADKKNMRRYLQLYNSQNENTEANDMHKLKLTTFLLHLHDVMFLNQRWLDAVCPYDLGSYIDPNTRKEKTHTFCAYANDEMSIIQQR